MRSSAPTQAKEYFGYKDIALYQGDALNPQTFSGEFADLIITSPPYNVDIKYNSNSDALSYEGYLDFSREWMTNCFNWSKPQARFLLNIPLDKNKGGQKSVGADITVLAQDIGWNYHSTIVWNEGNISRRTAWGSWLSASAPYVIAPVELIVVFYKGSWKKTGGSQISDITKTEFMEWTNGLWVFNGESKKRIGHPAPFPIQLPQRGMKLFSFVGDAVFDPFCGSGTTLIAALNCNRIGIGLEIDESYCELSKKRVLKQINEGALLWQT
ncbi:MAG: site-specific DNA-methyltransferase [Deferribacteraceae bacterium]|jgi:site-specific DNA-methyltransferase (adenine-specific)|nr:site-specific DNA-methyltransferase [Deferribacteraceae bacterium]